MRASLCRVFLSGWLTSTGACASSAATSNVDSDADSTRDESELDAGPVVDGDSRDAANPVERDANVAARRDAAADARSPQAGEDAGDSEGGGAMDAATPVRDATTPEDTSVTPTQDASVPAVEDAAAPPVADAAVDAGVVVPDAGPSMAPPTGCTARTLEAKSYLFCTQPLNWIAARNVCLKANLDIVVVNNAAESTFVAGNGDSWIGATDIDGEGSWVIPVPGTTGDYSGAAVRFTNWILAQPDNTVRCSGIATGLPCLGPRTDEDCAMVRSPDGQWNDDDCSATKSFVCEAL